MINIGDWARNLLYGEKSQDGQKGVVNMLEQLVEKEKQSKSKEIMGKLVKQAFTSFIPGGEEVSTAFNKDSTPEQKIKALQSLSQPMGLMAKYGGNIAKAIVTAPLRVGETAGRTYGEALGNKIYGEGFTPGEGTIFGGQSIQDQRRALQSQGAGPITEKAIPTAQYLIDMMLAKQSPKVVETALKMTDSFTKRNPKFQAGLSTKALSKEEHQKMYPKGYDPATGSQKVMTKHPDYKGSSKKQDVYVDVWEGEGHSGSNAAKIVKTYGPYKSSKLANKYMEENLPLKPGQRAFPRVDYDKGTVTKAKEILAEKKPPVEGGVSNQKWFRGQDQTNASGDKFFSTDKNVAGDFGKVSKINPSELPKNPLQISSKDELAQLIGYKGDPMAEAKLPIGQRFDTLARQYAQSKGYDGIAYMNGTLGSPELHSFPSVVEGGVSITKETANLSNGNEANVIKLNDKKVGVISMYEKEQSSLFPDKTEVYIENIEIKNKKQGIGTKVIDNIFKTTGTDTIGGNYQPKAKEFWKKIGANDNLKKYGATPDGDGGIRFVITKEDFYKNAKGISPSVVEGGNKVKSSK